MALLLPLLIKSVIVLNRLHPNSTSFTCFQIQKTAQTAPTRGLTEPEHKATFKNKGFAANIFVCSILF